jgi:cyclophilin family peptidyl-prolyl cis-trans isomerase
LIHPFELEVLKSDRATVSIETPTSWPSLPADRIDRMTLMTLLPFLLFFQAVGPQVPETRPAPGNPVAVISTSMGDFTVELLKDRAPVSVQNFLSYATAGFYEGTVFHRVISGFMIQGGGFTPDLVEKATRPPIRNEATNGLSNVRGTVAMARTRALRSATAQFFVNVADNRAKLDHRGYSPDDFGYAVFGRVLEGMEVCDRIAAVETRTVDPHEDVPIEPVVIKGVRVKQ